MTSESAPGAWLPGCGVKSWPESVPLQVTMRQGEEAGAGGRVSSSFARSSVLKALELSEEPDATLYDHLGDIYSALQEPAKAQEAWKKAFAIEPKEEIKKKLSPAPAETSSPSAP